MADVYMPRLSDSMAEGTVVRWLKQNGEAVRRGEGLVEIDTDKATVTFESEHDGELEIVAGPGATLPVGALIAYVGGPEGAGERAGPAVAAMSGADSPRATGRSPRRPPHQSPVTKRTENVSPTARRLAEALGVELSHVVGTGPGGRITRADIAAAAERGRGAATLSAPRSAPLEPAKGHTRIRELTRTQQTIARRMAEARRTIPDFTLDVDLDMDAARVVLAGLRSEPDGQHPQRPTLTDLLVKACALTLREFPAVNAAFRDGAVAEYTRVNVGIAVATQSALLVPTVFDADRKSVAEIANETRALASRARAGTISPAELAGGTFTVTNLGMYGVRRFQAIINPPQAAILAVGALRAVPTLREGSLAERDILTVSLTCDHRALYGVEAAQFLQRLGELLRNPRDWCRD